MALGVGHGKVVNLGGGSPELVVWVDWRGWGGSG